MSELFRLDPVGRFRGLSDAYAKHRPDYPSAALDFLLDHCELRPGGRAVDVGCGTGIFTRQLAQRGLLVIGIEPNAEMRALAERASLDLPAIQYRDGKAEATGLPEKSADLVLAAQAFHWFEPNAALREFHRLLRPDGWVVVLWNERDEADPFTRAYGDAFRAVSNAAQLERSRLESGAVLLACPLFEKRERRAFPHAQELDEEGLLGRAFSTSYAPREPILAASLAAALRDLFAHFQREGRVVLRYQTSLYLGRRESPTSEQIIM
jgi:SAM-dependent methyltransferase